MDNASIKLASTVYKIFSRANLLRLVWIKIKFILLFQIMILDAFLYTLSKSVIKENQMSKI